MSRLFLLLPLVLISCTTMPIDKPGYLVERRKFRATSPEDSSIKISLWDQKAWLLNGSGTPVLEADVATGVPGKETPEGTFTVLERLESKRSNRYGRYVDDQSGKVTVLKAWEHKGAPPVGSSYVGIAMPYWMRLTWTGIGMHVGKFEKRTRSSFGCIRVFEPAQPLIFEKTKLGTKVEIVSKSLILKYGL